MTKTRSTQQATPAQRLARAVEGPTFGLLRRVARASSNRLRPGTVTILIVGWNSIECLGPTLEAVRRRTSPDVRICVIDNGSTDGSRKLLRSRRDVRSILLPVNIGHAAALNLGVLLARTEFSITLDVDAFPLRAGWTDVLLEPLNGSTTVAGAYLQRNYIHPCCLAIRTRDFVERAHSFKPHRPWDVSGLGSTTWDVGERISMTEVEAGHELHRIGVTEVRGPGNVGTVFGDLVYHNFYGTRFAATPSERLDDVVRREDPGLAWQEAVQRWVS